MMSVASRGVASRDISLHHQHHHHHHLDSFQHRELCPDPMFPSYFPPSASFDLGVKHHQQLLHHQQHLPQLLHRVPACDGDVPVSLTQEELQRLLDAADYAKRERVFLLQALEGLSLSESRTSSPSSSFTETTSLDSGGASPVHGQSHASAAPVLLRDEGGLFRLVNNERSTSLPPSHQHHQQKMPPQCLFPSEEASDDLESDHFRMFRFKVQMCRESRCHDWAQCPFAHPGEKASRRDPRVYRYSAVPCPDVKRNGKCSRGDACTMAHGVFECWLHPARYRTQPCKDGAKCPRKVCFFAHSTEQLRLAPAAAAAAAAEVNACNGSSCDSRLQRWSFDVAPSSMTHVKATSPSSVLSPSHSSPPTSPLTRSGSLSTFSANCGAALEAQKMLPLEPIPSEPMASSQFGQFLEAHAVLPHTVVPVPPPVGCVVPRPLSHPHSEQMPQQWPFEQSRPAVPSPVQAQTLLRTSHEEEPDLKWISDLIQDQ